MGKTITEKILAKASGQAAVSPGDYIELSSDRPVTMGFHNPPDKGQWELVTWGVKPFDPTKIRLVDGHYGINPTESVRARRQLWRDWCRDMGVPKENMYELGRQGAEQILTSEKGWALPGSVVMNGVNGHSSTAGAIGCFAFALSGGLGAYLIEGKTWAKVPETCKIVLKGKMPKGVTSRDLSEYVLSQIGTSGAVGMVTEWTGPVVDEMNMDARFCLCSVTLFTGAWTSIMNPDEKTIEWVKSHTDESFEPVTSDSNAHYAKVYEFDVSDVVPQIVMPGYRYDVRPITEVAGLPINRGMIGSECNGWLSDLRMAAEILDGRKIHSDMILEIVPGSQNILLNALDAGYVRTFLKAECVLYTPGTDFNHTPLGVNDSGIHTQQTNSPGRAGSTESKLFLSSPYTVAASSIEGKIVDPRKYL